MYAARDDLENPLPTAVIVDAVRTPIGRREGQLRDLHAVDLAALPLAALMNRSTIDHSLVEDVIMGCVTQTGEQGFNIARNAALAAGFPVSVAGVTIDRQGTSSQQAVHFGAQAVMSGGYDCVIAAGVEAMSRIPLGVTAYQGPGQPFGPAMQDRFKLVPTGVIAETLAREHSLTREDLDAIAADSHRRAGKATTQGRFSGEIVPVEVGLARPFSVDEGIRSEEDLALLADLEPAFEEGGMVTSGNSAPIADGAAAVLIMSADRAETLGLQPLAAVRAFSAAAVDPLQLTAPVTATEIVLGKAGLSFDDIDLFEVHEAFASVVAVWLAETAADGLWERTNVNGGAIALGDPQGASGARLLTTLVHELVRSQKRYGLQVMSGSGGLATGLIIERL